MVVMVINSTNTSEKKQCQAIELTKYDLANLFIQEEIISYVAFVSCNHLNVNIDVEQSLTYEQLKGILLTVAINKLEFGIDIDMQLFTILKDIHYIALVNNGELILANKS